MVRIIGTKGRMKELRTTLMTTARYRTKRIEVYIGLVK
jgi:hypothetical protein